jgi:succinate dehydrogenase/fumarate reductase-like Fe-S protein
MPKDHYVELLAALDAKTALEVRPEERAELDGMWECILCF